MKARWWKSILGCCLFAPAILAQNTQGRIQGSVLDRESHNPVAGALVTYRSGDRGDEHQVQADAHGAYVIPALSPGTYRLRAFDAQREYQPQQVDDLEVRVAARVTLDFMLRPASDILEYRVEQGMVLPENSALVRFFGPDVEQQMLA